MIDLLTKYFLTNREVVLPGIGQLQSVQIPARFDAARQIMLPPSESFQWNPDSESTLSPQGLMGFLSRQRQWSEEDSFEEVTAFCNRVKNELNQSGQWVWPGLGKLIAISEGTFGFVPDSNFEKYYKPISASRVEHPDHQASAAEHDNNINETGDDSAEAETPTTTNRWWIPALALGILALAAIIARQTGLI